MLDNEDYPILMVSLDREKEAEEATVDQALNKILSIVNEQKNKKLCEVAGEVGDFARNGC